MGRRPGTVGGGVLRRHDQPHVSPQLADAHERRPGPATACSVLRPPGRGLARLDLRHAEAGGQDPPVGRGHRLLLLPAAAQGRPRQVHPRGVLRPGLVPRGVRRGDRAHQAGVVPTRRQHGHPRRHPPGHRGLHRRQAVRGHHQLQPVRRRDRRVDGDRSSRRRPTTWCRPAPARSSARRTQEQCSRAWSMPPGRRATPVSSSSTG